MKNKVFNNTLNSQNGFVLVTALIIMVVLILLGTFALNTTNTEIQVASNDRLNKEDFFNQESCITTGKFAFRTWLTSAYLTQAETAASFPPAGSNAGNCVNPNNAALVIGAYKVRNVEATNTPIAWDDSASFGNAASHPANDFPTMSHRDKPDPVSENDIKNVGNDPKNFEIRRFVITSYSPAGDRNVTVQQGVYKVFNKF
jgi:Tfp pilus assembly protein PilX